MGLLLFQPPDIFRWQTSARCHFYVVSKPQEFSSIKFLSLFLDPYTFFALWYHSASVAPLHKEIKSNSHSIQLSADLPFLRLWERYWTLMQASAPTLLETPVIFHLISWPGWEDGAIWSQAWHVQQVNCCCLEMLWLGYDAYLFKQEIMICFYIIKFFWHRWNWHLSLYQIVQGS